MLLGQIVAKILGLTEAILDNFVTVSGPVADPFLNNCYGPMSVYTVNLEACGATLAQQLANLMVVGLNILNGIFPGLLAQQGTGF
jgi:hypothetical protein